MDITFVGPVCPDRPRAGGTQTYLFGLARALSRLGHHITVIGIGTPQSGVGSEFKFLSLTADSSPSGLQYLVALGARGPRLVSRHSILHTQRADDLLGFALRRDIAARIVTIHGNAFAGVRERHGAIVAAGFRGLECLGLQTADRIVTLDKATQSQLKADFPNLSSRTLLGTGGVDLEVFSPRTRAEARADLGLRDMPTIAFVGRLFPEKNLPVLLDALNKLDAVQFVVAGEGPFQRRLLTWGRNRPLFHFLGAVKSTTVARILNAADALALPSQREAMPAACLEALACGTPIVASPVGGLTGLISDGRNGYLVPPNPDLVAARLKDCIEHGSGWRSFCRESVRPYAWETVARAMEGIYAEATS